MLSEKPTGTVKAQGWRKSPDRDRVRLNWRIYFVESPALTPGVPAVEKLLQRLVMETQSRPPPAMSPPAPTELEQMMR